MLLLSFVDAVASVDSFIEAQSSTSVGNARTANSLGQFTGVDFVATKHPSSNLFKGAAGSSGQCVKGRSLSFDKLNIVEKHGGWRKGIKE